MQVIVNMPLTTCLQGGNKQAVDKLLEQHCYKSAAVSYHLCVFIRVYIPIQESYEL